MSECNSCWGAFLSGIAGTLILVWFASLLVGLTRDD